MSEQQVETVTHGADTYVFNSQETRDAAVTHLDHGRMPDYCRTVYYDFELSGVHDGPPIKVRMVGPDYEVDDGGVAAVWDKLLFADDSSEIESAWILDAYTDALRDELLEIIKETWD